MDDLKLEHGIVELFMTLHKVELNAHKTVRQRVNVSLRNLMRLSPPFGTALKADESLHALWIWTSTHILRLPHIQQVQYVVHEMTHLPDGFHAVADRVSETASPPSHDDVFPDRSQGATTASLSWPSTSSPMLPCSPLDPQRAGCASHEQTQQSKVAGLCGFEDETSKHHFRCPVSDSLYFVDRFRVNYNTALFIAHAASSTTISGVLLAWAQAQPGFSGVMKLDSYRAICDIPLPVSLIVTAKALL